MIMDYIIENHSLVEYKGSAEIITIQDVATIDSFAFKGNSTLKSITISSDIRIIKDRAFECCYALEELIINSQDLVIEEYAFNNCPKLRTVRIAKGISDRNLSLYHHELDLRCRICHVSSVRQRK